MSGPTSKTLLYRDGTSQADRMQPALKPDAVSVDKRTLGDLLRFARDYSHLLRWFDFQNQDAGDWRGLLGSAQGDDAIDLEELATVAQALMEGRDTEGDAATRALIARPHVALYIAFAKLLGLTQDQLDDLTRRHLEFYYEKVLRMTRKPAQPDRVNVWFELAPHTNRTIRLDKDTALIAKDHTGQPCTYRTREPLFVNRARIEQLRSIHVEKGIMTLADAGALRHQDTQAALLKMLEIALGDPQPGDPLPVYPRNGETIDFPLLATDLLRLVHAEPPPLDQRAPWFLDVADMRSLMDHREEERWSAVNKILEAAGKRKRDDPDFELQVAPGQEASFTDNLWSALGEEGGAPEAKTKLAGQLGDHYAEIRHIEGFFYMSAEAFATMMLVAKQGTGGTERDWRRIGDLLAESHKKRVYARRRKDLQDVRNQHQEREDRGFLPMIQAALGQDPADAGPVAEYPADALPPPLERLSDFIEPGDTVKGVSDPQTFLADQYREALQAQGSPAWDQVYHIVELAQRRREQLLDPVPRQVEWRNLYPFADARSVKSNLGLAGEDELPHWKTFGRVPHGLGPKQPAAETLGWAISSPLLSLSEGTRTIDLILGFRPETFATEGKRRLIDDAGNLVEDLADAFHVELSAGTEWVSSDALEDPAFGLVYDEIVREGSDPIPAFRYSLTLPPDAPALTRPLSSDNRVVADWPVLRIRLRQHWQAQELRYTIRYALLRDLVLESAHLKVTVAGLISLRLQSDDKGLDSTKPFEPFGARPAVGSRFYIGHPELIVKELDELRFAIEWMGLPEAGLQTHYATYGYKNPDGSDHPSPITSHRDFKIDVALVENRVEHDLESKKELFTTEGDATHKETGSPSFKVTTNLEGHQRILALPTTNQLLSWPRCVRWELNPKDFLHAAYPAIAARKAMGLAAAIANKGATDEINPDEHHVNPPYTPTIKTLQLGYVSSTELPLDGSVLPPGDRLLHIHPFGSNPVQAEAKPWFLPCYDNQGELYIGIADAGAGEIASILFQMAEGSANPDLEPEPIAWSYLDDNRWRSLHEGKLRSDATGGLINSGIIRLELPQVRPSTRLPGDLIWLRATIDQHPESVCDTVALHTQAVSAEYLDNAGAPAHYGQPLAPKSIAGLATPRAAIAAVHQPYTSWAGKPSEQADIFYTRVAERLHHKQRALAAWDYERLILEHFPQLHKAKCLASDFERLQEPGKPDTSTPGLIDIVVIPDIRNQRPFDPFAPKAPSNLLAEIERYLADKIPVSARVQVRNAHYVPVKTRFAVRFKPDVDQGYARAQLVAELNRFLSPWAYDEGAEITIGGRIYANSLVDFIDRRDYVDYVAALKLFKREKHTSDFRIVFPGADSNGYQVASDYPDGVLVADRDHVIDIITDIGYEEESFTGINHMRVELDFVVAPDPVG